MIDNRKEKRIENENRVIIEYFPDGRDSRNNKKVNALTKDLSIGGARIITDNLFPNEKTLNITLFLSQSKQTVKLQGKVKWVRSLGDEELFEVGVEFVHDISKTVLAIIRHLYGKENGIPSVMHT